jgi:hypothetical protein
MWKSLSHLTLVLAVLFALGCADKTPETTEPAETTADVEADAADMPEAASYTVPLSGANEVPGPGDADGTGTASLTFDPEQGEICYEITVSNIGEATAAHIHQGAAGASGGPVVNMDVATNGLDGCVTGVSRDVMAPILANPSGYYFNVHTAEFGAGAVRGQVATM